MVRPPSRCGRGHHPPAPARDDPLDQRDPGRSWRAQPLTPKGSVNQNWARRVMQGRPDFNVLWTDGNTMRVSQSRLYFSDRAGNTYALPEVHEGKERPARADLQGPRNAAWRGARRGRPARGPN